jgi:hypothetical protein
MNLENDVEASFPRDSAENAVRSERAIFGLSAREANHRPKVAQEIHPMCTDPGIAAGMVVVGGQASLSRLSRSCSGLD